MEPARALLRPNSPLILSLLLSPALCHPREAFCSFFSQFLRTEATQKRILLCQQTLLKARALPRCFGPARFVSELIYYDPIISALPARSCVPGPLFPRFLLLP